MVIVCHSVLATSTEMYVTFAPPSLPQYIFCHGGTNRLIVTWDFSQIFDIDVAVIPRSSEFRGDLNVRHHRTVCAVRLFARTYASLNLTGLGPESVMLLSWPTQVTLGAFALTCYIGVIWANALVGCLGRCGAQDSSTIFSSGNSVEWTTIGLIFPPPLDIESSARPLKLRSFPPLNLPIFFLSEYHFACGSWNFSSGLAGETADTSCGIQLKFGRKSAMFSRFPGPGNGSNLL